MFIKVQIRNKTAPQLPKAKVEETTNQPKKEIILLEKDTQVDTRILTIPEDKNPKP